MSFYGRKKTIAKPVICYTRLKTDVLGVVVKYGLMHTNIAQYFSIRWCAEV